MFVMPEPRSLALLSVSPKLYLSLSRHLRNFDCNVNGILYRLKLQISRYPSGYMGYLFVNGNYLGAYEFESHLKFHEFYYEHGNGD